VLDCCHYYRLLGNDKPVTKCGLLTGIVVAGRHAPTAAFEWSGRALRTQGGVTLEFGLPGTVGE
jgi:hypothetical protein